MSGKASAIRHKDERVTTEVNENDLILIVRGCMLNTCQYSVCVTN